MASVIDAAIETVQHAADASGIEHRAGVEPAPAPTVGDPGRLQQVIWNLLTNAIKFTPPGGRMRCDCAASDSAREITVIDTGIGIQPEFLPHVFDRFQQADSPTTRRHGGLGLGLAIVRHLVELHGGQVWASSEGAGSRRQVHRGAADDGRRGVAETERTLPSIGTAPLDNHTLKDIRVLVVEDEADNRDLIRRLLEAHGAEVVTAATAMEAVEKASIHRPDILVSDIGLPDVDGYELIRRIRQLQIEGLDTIPAVALTAFARSEDRTRALRAGYQAHISKPVEPAELVATLASFADLMERR